MKWQLFLCSFLLLTCTAGCGPRLCDVSGLVSLDGKPAPAGLKITFEPRDGNGDIVLSVTENDGRYRLIHRSGKPGIQMGSYTVSVGFWGDAKTNPPGLAALKIPEAFREGSSTTVCDVRSEIVQFDIAVTSR